MRGAIPQDAHRLVGLAYTETEQLASDGPSRCTGENAAALDAVVRPQRWEPVRRCTSSRCCNCDQGSAVQCQRPRTAQQHRRFCTGGAPVCKKKRNGQITPPVAFSVVDRVCVPTGAAKSQVAPSDTSDGAYHREYFAGLLLACINTNIGKVHIDGEPAWETKIARQRFIFSVHDGSQPIQWVLC